MQHRDALIAAAKAVLEEDNFATVARRIFDSCCQLTGATSGYVALLSPDGQENELVFLEAGGRPCTVDPELPMPIRGLRAEAYRSGEVAYDNDFHHSDWMRFMPAGHVRLDNVLFAPLVVEGRTVGIMGIANKPTHFTEEDGIARAAGRGLSGFLQKPYELSEMVAVLRSLLEASPASGQDG